MGVLSDMICIQHVRREYKASSVLIYGCICKPVGQGDGGGVVGCTEYIAKEKAAVIKVCSLIIEIVWGFYLVRRSTIALPMASPTFM